MNFTGRIRHWSLHWHFLWLLCALASGCGEPAAPLPSAAPAAKSSASRLPDTKLPDSKGNAAAGSTASAPTSPPATSASQSSQQAAPNSVASNNNAPNNSASNSSASNSSASNNSASNSIAANNNASNRNLAGAAGQPGTGQPGSGQPAAAGGNGATVAEPPPPQPDDAGGKSWATNLSLPLEFWEGQYLNAQRIGVTHYKIDKADSERLRLEATTTMTVLRGKQPISQTVAVETIERASGVVDSFFENISDNNGTVSKQGGSITDERLKLRTGNANQPIKEVLWPATCWGPMGIQQMLWRQPMTSGERRVAQVFLPQAHQLARITLVAGQIEDTTSPQGLLPKVLPIDALMQLEKEGLAIRLWTDSAGHILKTAWLQGLNLSSYRITQAAAEQMQAQGTVDLLAATSINVSPPLVDADKASRITYRVESSQVDPVRLFSSQSNQSFGKSTIYQVDLIVARPQVQGQPAPGAAQTAPGPECLASSSIIGSQDLRVAELAAELAGDERNSAAVAMKLTQGVYSTIRKKNFSSLFESAQDVARTLEGDCTEHAVLLAALLRSRQVPSRIASGLVLTSSDKGTVFLYHMWTEAWLGDRWLPLDATTGKPTHCGYIKFLETALEGDNPYKALLPVLQSLGNLKISALEISP